MSVKKVAVLQSNYIPWKGYFDIINDVDLFVFYDEVKYTKNDWRNRNIIYTSAGLRWITLPCGYDFTIPIDHVKLKNELCWQQKHFSQLIQSYSDAPFFYDYIDFLEELYLHRQWTFLSELNQYIIKTISKDFLHIDTEFANSRDFETHGQKNERLLSLITATDAKIYLSGPAAKDYIVEDDYLRSGIEIQWKDYNKYPEYLQRHVPFEHNVSILDLLFNVGEEAAQYIWGLKP